ncbi:unnamed protein product [Urochloa decumbens]|uniref:F-box domain-containing protein n=1 Tax=Urochloa decumbens TaxID=240449 RepID=A0ABC8VYI1_9POAL
MAGGPSSKKSSKKRRARRRRCRKRNPAAELPDDLLLEILARVPYRSLCRFRCVSKRWSALISDPKNREKLPQTLAGFFYRMPSRGSTPHSYGFLNVYGTGVPFIDPSFSFLPDSEREGLELVDCCNGLILSRSIRFADNFEFHYLVLNPATKKWVAVPVTWSWSNKVRMARLGFDPAVSPHFYVFEFQSYMKDDNNDSDDDDNDDSDEDDSDDDSDDDDSLVLGVKIYSSATGVWIHKQSDWSTGISLQLGFKSVFLDGVLYVIAVECVIGAVDVEGRTWRVIKFPRRKDLSSLDAAAAVFIDLSQGRLHFVKAGLGIWVLENKDSKKWTLKDTGRSEHLFGTKNVVAIHPDRNMVFCVFGRERTLKSYDMDSRKECIICYLGSSEIEHFIPYVPLFSKSLPDDGNQ